MSTVKNNLDQQLEWLQHNLKEAQLSGFTYGPVVTAKSKASYGKSNKL